MLRTIIRKKMNKTRKADHVLKFTSIAFEPILLVMLPLLPGFFISALVSFLMPDVGAGDALELLAFALGLTAYFVFIAIKCFNKYILAAKPKNRLAVMAAG